MAFISVNDNYGVLFHNEFKDNLRETDTIDHFTAILAQSGQHSCLTAYTTGPF